MEYKRLSESDLRFMTLVWDNEPVGSMSLVKLCEGAFGWKKSTTFTMLKRLAEKGLLKNDGAVVTSLVPRNSVQRTESRLFVDQAFSGSLPDFLAAFFGGNTISEEEASELYALIEAHRRGDKQ